MTKVEDMALRFRAKRAYELGRLKRALATAAWVGPMMALGLLGCTGPKTVMGIALALFGSCAWMVWRGGALEQAVAPGLAGGLVPLLVPVALEMTGHGCVVAPSNSVCIPVCLAAGLVCGVIIWLRIGNEKRSRIPTLTAAAMLACVTGAMGCAALGTGGLLGMAAGILVSSVPLGLIIRHPQAP